MNPPSKVREAVYLFTIFLNATYAIAATEIKFSIWVVAVVGGYNALVAAMAKSNVSK